MRNPFTKFFSTITLTLCLCGAAAAQDYLPELVKRIKPSAVAIETFDSKGKSVARGSGFFIAADKVITNRHVIERAAKVDIQLANGKTFVAKGVLAVDGESDLALLEIDVPRELAQPLPIVQRPPLEGESVVVIGNPFGLEGSVSNGIVSAIREIGGYGTIIQITAPIAPGSSGSPVVNMFGQVIGVATAQASEGQSINFAIPSSRIARLKIGQTQTFSSLSSETARNKRSSAEKLYAQGLAQMSMDDYGKALPFFEKATETDPDYAEAWYQAGFCYGMLGRHEDALRASRQAARIRPDWAESYVNIGASSFALGQFEEAVNAYRQATRLDEGNAEAQYALGLALNRTSKPDLEVLAYRRAVAIKPDFPNAYEQLGIALFKMKRYADAAASFEQLRAYRPDAKAYNYLGECYLESGKFNESIEAFNNAVGYNPNFDKARYNLGRAYLKIEDKDSATVQFEILRSARSEWADRLFVLINP